MSECVNLFSSDSFLATDARKVLLHPYAGFYSEQSKSMIPFSLEPCFPTWNF